VTVFTLGGLVGSLSADSISRRFDRVGALRIAEIGYIAGALVIAGATQIWMVVVGRLAALGIHIANLRILIGISSGLVLVTIPPFLSQISPEKYHTLLGTLHQSSIGMGMLGAQSLSLLLAKPRLWRVELLVAAGIAAALLVVGLFVKDAEAERDLKSGEDADVNERSALLHDQGERLRHFWYRFIAAYYSRQ
jgi:MFS family permease